MRLIVYNPQGGAAIWRWRLRASLRELAKLGPHEVVATEAADMSAPVRRALADHPDISQIVACGGDGTVAACAAALDGRAIPVAIVPTGTTNVLAYEIGVPAHPVQAARSLAKATRLAPFRLWNVNGTPMLLQLGIGFDGRLIWRTPRKMKRAFGFLGVVASALKEGVAFDYPLVRVTGELAGGDSRSVVATSALVANAKRWAGAPILIPNADPSDEVVDVLLLQYRNFSQLAAFWFAILLPGAPHLKLPFVEHVRMRCLRVEALGRAVEAHVDGEPTAVTPLEVKPAAIVHLVAPDRASARG